MSKYGFLFKPSLFIFNLLFATWLVFKIEKISPSDFGKYGRFLEEGPSKKASEQKNVLKKLCRDYRSGSLDSLKLEEMLDKILIGQLPGQVAQTPEKAQ